MVRNRLGVFSVVHAPYGPHERGTATKNVRVLPAALTRGPGTLWIVTPATSQLLQLWSVRQQGQQRTVFGPCTLTDSICIDEVRHQQYKHR